MGPFRIFVAAAYRERDRAAVAAKMLNQHGGHTVCSSWHSGVAIPGCDASITDLTERMEICETNRRDLRNANVFVLLASPYCQGAFAEFGDAYSDAKRMYVVGDALQCPLTLFRRGVRFLETIEQVITALAAV